MTISKDKLAGGALLGAVASGLAAAALSCAGTANATCASISGIGNGPGIGGGSCNSSLTSFAVGLGTNAQASANGLFDSAIAIGDNSQVTTVGNFDTGIAVGSPSLVLAGNTPADSFNTTIAIGTDAAARTRGIGNIAVAVGNPGPNPGFVLPNILNQPGPTHRTFAEAAGTFNRAFAFGDGSIALADGGPITGALLPIGNNTAISLGNSANSYAGTIPVDFNTNSPNNQFAFAGSFKTAVNAVNP
jgi:hypothetical protein